MLTVAELRAAVTAATDPIVQHSQIAMGLREKYDPAQTALSALAAGGLSGVLNAAPEAVSALVRAIGLKSGKPEAKVTIEDVAATLERDREFLMDASRVDPRLRVFLPDAMQRALAESGIRPMDFTGKPAKGMVYVGPEVTADDRQLESWVEEGVSFASSLPPKPKRG